MKILVMPHFVVMKKSILGAGFNNFNLDDSNLEEVDFDTIV